MIKKINTPFSVSTVVFAGLLFVSTCVPAIESSDCNNLKGCERKFCVIEQQLNIAQGKGNKRKSVGLRKSLDNAKEHCTDNGLKEDLIREIEDTQKDITEYESDLKEAEEYGKNDKVRKYQVKIKEEQNKIKRLEDELSNLN
ncbi:MAG: DUF1090 domain-containing protein [Thermodesulfobacteriota bacterium]|nr:DUF1090 domain-containing protein [Thermodesulfobacteriota bacterium]